MYPFCYYYHCVFNIFYFMILGIEPRGMYTLDKCYITGVSPLPFFFFLLRKLKLREGMDSP